MVGGEKDVVAAPLVVEPLVKADNNILAGVNLA
jgi:hypothetical protein